MTEPRVWKKVGPQIVLAEKYGKELATQKFRNPHTGKLEEYSLFGQKDWSVMLPITDSN